METSGGMEMVKKNNEYNHLIWRLMKYEGLTKQQAMERVTEMVEWNKKVKKIDKDKKNGK